jgi:glycosyltransferase involved in cell wall biosynthesis
MKDVISVVTPVYNGKDHIAECVRSVAVAVTNDKITIEHIIIDDGSTDDSLGAIPSRYRTNLIVRRLACHTGKPAAARNAGISFATSKYIFCLDHDDVLIQTALIYLYEHLQAGGLQVAYGDFLRTNATMEYRIGGDYWGWNHQTTQDLLYSIFMGEHFYQHSIMFTRELWQLVGGYDTAITYGEDLDLCIRFILAGHPPAHTRTITHLHRDHGRNLTSCYDPSLDPSGIAWLAERRAHYHKYQEVLPYYLSPDRIAAIKLSMKITPDIQLDGRETHADPARHGYRGEASSPRDIQHH